MTKDPVTEIEARYRDIDKAFRHKDLDTVAKHIAPNWTGTDAGKPVTRQDLLDNVKRMFDTLSDITWPRTVKPVSVDEHKVVVIAEGDYRAKKTESGEPVEMHLSNKDTWTDQGGEWKVSASLGLE